MARRPKPLPSGTYTLEVESVGYDNHTYKSGPNRGRSERMVKGTFNVLTEDRLVWHAFWPSNGMGELSRLGQATGKPRADWETIPQWLARLTRTPNLFFRARIDLIQSEQPFNRIDFYTATPVTQPVKIGILAARRKCQKIPVVLRIPKDERTLI